MCHMMLHILDEYSCSDPPTTMPEYNTTYYRMSAVLCREICQGKGHDYAVLSGDNCQCHNGSAVEGLSRHSLTQCNTSCSTNYYQQCGGDSGHSTIIHSSKYGTQSKIFLSCSFWYHLHFYTSDVNLGLIPKLTNLLATNIILLPHHPSQQSTINIQRAPSTLISKP